MNFSAKCVANNGLDDRFESFGLAGRFDRVLIAYNSLYCLESEADQVSCLANAARHLTPEGRIVLDAYAIDAFHFEADETDEGEDDAVDVVLAPPFTALAALGVDVLGCERDRGARATRMAL